MTDLNNIPAGAADDPLSDGHVDAHAALQFMGPHTAALMASVANLAQAFGVSPNLLPVSSTHTAEAILGWSPGGSTTISTVAAPAGTGVPWVTQMAATAEGNRNYHHPNLPVPVIAGQPATFIYSFRGSVQRRVRLQPYWRPTVGSGAWTSISASAWVTCPPNQWTEIRFAPLIPAGGVEAYMMFTVEAMAAGEQVLFTKAGIFQGEVATWAPSGAVPPPAGARIIAIENRLASLENTRLPAIEARATELETREQTVRMAPGTNRLTLQQAMMAEPRDTGWTSTGNNPEMVPSPDGSGGAFALRTTSGAAGAVNINRARNAATPASFRVIPGREYTIAMAMRAVTVGRSCTLALHWHNVGGTNLGSTTSPAQTSSTSEWTHFVWRAIAPAGAEFITPYPQVSATAAGEQHLFTDVAVIEGAAASWAPPGAQPATPLLTPITDRLSVAENQTASMGTAPGANRMNPGEAFQAPPLDARWAASGWALELIPNPDGAGPLAPGSTTRSSHVLRMTKTGSAGTMSLNRTGQAFGRHPIAGGRRYSCFVSFRSSVAHEFSFRMVWHDQANAGVGTTSGPPNQVSATSEWKTFHWQANAPVAAAFLTPWLTSDGQYQPGETILVKDFAVIEGSADRWAPSGAQPRVDAPASLDGAAPRISFVEGRIDGLDQRIDDIGQGGVASHTVAFISDQHVDSTVGQAINRAILEHLEMRFRPLAYCFCGDMFNLPNQTNLDLFDQFWGSGAAVNIAALGRGPGRQLHVVPGNHDLDNSTGGLALWDAWWTARGQDFSSVRYHSFDLPNGWHGIGLSLNDGDNIAAGSAQHTWLANDLDANKGKPTFLFWHRARFSIGWSNDRSSFQPVYDLFAANPQVQFVVNGHDHTYYRFPASHPGANGVQTINAGSTSGWLLIPDTNAGRFSEVVGRSSLAGDVSGGDSSGKPWPEVKRSCLIFRLSPEGWDFRPLFFPQPNEAGDTVPGSEATTQWHSFPIGALV